MIPRRKNFVWKHGPPEKTPNPLRTTPLGILICYSTHPEGITAPWHVTGHLNELLLNHFQTTAGAKHHLKNVQEMRASCCWAPQHIWNAMRPISSGQYRSETADLVKILIIFKSYLERCQPVQTGVFLGQREINPDWFLNVIKISVQGWVWEESFKEREKNK